MKKQNPRNAGRKRHGKKAKEKISICLDPDDIKWLDKNFPGGRSAGIQLLIKSFREKCW